MCGKFILTGGTRLLLKFKEEFGVEVAEPDDIERVLPDRGMIFLPYHDVPVFYTDREGIVRVREMYWQLIHYWNRQFKSDYTQFNTRVESLPKRQNRELLERRRCIFPVSSFFETRKVGGRTVTPKESYEFTLDDQEIIPLGGIYSVWINPEDENDRHPSCSIITVEPNSLIAGVHNRMPFVIQRDHVATWLDRSIDDFDTLMNMIGPIGSGGMGRSKVGGDTGQKGML